MAQGDNLCTPPRQSGRPDLLVIGGGIMGLWAALNGCRRGLSVMLVEERAIGAGASGGLLGALMPHMPDRWTDKKQLQFDALVSLETDIATLEAETGLSAGYRRTGRLIPLPKPHLVDLARGHERDALSVWNQKGRPFFWHCREPGYRADLINPEVTLAGCVEETLAARVSPRGLTGLLHAALLRLPHFSLLTGDRVVTLDADKGNVRLESGRQIAFGQAVLAAGAATEALLDGLIGPLPKKIVVPVKGQAALLQASLPPETPVIYLDGLYVVPHEGGEVAIGSTSENVFAEPFSTDHQLERLIASARELVPLLSDAPVIERWAGLRPKAIGRDPMVGMLPDHPRIAVLTGGFKVSFGLAHALAEALVAALVTGDGKTGLPAQFSPEHHLFEAGMEKAG